MWEMGLERRQRLNADEERFALGRVLYSGEELEGCLREMYGGEREKRCYRYLCYPYVVALKKEVLSRLSPRK